MLQRDILLIDCGKRGLCTSLIEECNVFMYVYNYDIVQSFDIGFDVRLKLDVLICFIYIM